MSIRQYRALNAIGAYGSFARAADALNVTQSAISSQIVALETTLGVQLFDRNRRPPQLTAFGKVALRHAQTIVAQHDELLETLGAGRSSSAELRLGAIPTVLTTLLPRALILLRERHPELLVSVSSGLSGRLLDSVRSGEIDAALMHQPRTIGPDLEWREVTRQSIVVVAPPMSTATSLPELFAQTSYIRFNRSAWVAPLIEARLASLGLEPTPRAEIESIEAIHMLVSLNFGASILPDVGAPRISGARLRVLPFGEPPLFRAVGLLARPGGAAQAARRLTADALSHAATEIRQER